MPKESGTATHPNRAMTCCPRAVVRLAISRITAVTPKVAWAYRPANSHPIAG